MCWEFKRHHLRISHKSVPLGCTIKNLLSIYSDTANVDLHAALKIVEHESERLESFVFPRTSVSHIIMLLLNP